MKIVISVVVPVKDEAENIAPLAAEIEAAMVPEDWQWEAVWVDDGSTDHSLAAMMALSQRNPCHRYVSFTKNAGQSAALMAGFKKARGGIIATVDGDGQNDPADIPRLVKILRAGGADMVNGFRQRRQDGWVRRAVSKIANGFRNLVTGKTVRDVGCSTRVFKRDCVDCLPPFKGMHRFLPTLVQMQGYTLSEEPVNHRPRKHGRTKYSINNRLWVGLFDTFGVFWLRRRVFVYSIKTHSESHGEVK